MIVFNEAKPKYEKLDELLESQLVDIRYTNQVNILVDLKELARKFFRPDINVDGIGRGNLISEISSDIINTIGHYRNYFFKRGKYTTFYFLYSYKPCEGYKKLFADYKKEYYAKYLEGEDPKVGLIKKAIQITEKVINKAIPHAYFIETSDYDEFVNARYILENIVNKNELTLIISNDDIFYQLVDDHTYILEPKGIKSVLLSSDTIIKTLTEDDSCQLSYHSIPAILALSGVKRYSFKTLPKVALKKAVAYLTKLKEKGLFVDLDSIDSPIEFGKLSPKIPLEKKLLDAQQAIEETYGLIRGDDMLYQNSLTLKSKYAGLSATRTPMYFKDLNSKVFPMHPLQADMILKGEKL